MGVTHFDGIDAVTTLMKGGVEITASAAELNILDGASKAVKEISLSFDYDDMTDDGSTSGHIDFATDALPADVIVLGWKCVTTTGFTGDTTATVKVGTSGTTDLYSAVTNGSVAAAGTVGSVCKTTGVVFNEAAATPRVTITGSADFTSISAGSATVTLYYI